MTRLFDTAGFGRRTHVLLALCLLLWPAAHASAQGVTTSAMGGTVKDSQGLAVPGATVVAVHEPSGTQYEAVTQGDGRFSILGMRVGGPYTVTATLEGFQPQPVKDVFLSLGVTADVPLTLLAASVTETITVTATSDPIFSSSRTGAGTAVSREDLATLPTTSGRLSDFTRLTPFASGQSVSGQDNRLNNITVDGSSFNNSFGLAGAPGERTGVAPISLEAIEQVQINVAPFDVRQGNFVGAGVNTVTRSGTNKLTGSIYTRFRNDEFVGTEAKGLAYNPGSFDFNNTGGWASGPIIKNRLFAFGLYEDEEDTRPLTTFRANAGGEPVGGNVTRVLTKDLNDLSSFLQQRYNYETGAYDNVDDLTPVKRFLVRGDWNLNNTNKFSVRYNYLDSSTDVPLSTSASLGFGRDSNRNTNFLSFANSNYSILENIRSTIGEWNSVFGTSLANSLIVGYTEQDESRGYKGEIFPFVDILDGSGVAYTSFGFEPFTPNNELRYNTFQLQDNFTKFTAKHTLTFGASLERYESENVFYPGSQSVYVYNTLADFYAAAAGQPVTTRRFQVRYMNIPGLDKPVQPLEVWFNGYYAQDEWRPASNLSLTGGLRIDIPYFGDTAYANPAVDALTFRDENGQPVQYSTGKLPDPKILWSPRVGFNWDLAGDQKTQVRGGTGVFTGRPAYVWISNQIGNTGMLTGFTQVENTTAYPFNPNPDAYKPTNITGAPAASVDLAVTDPDFRFPQIWRTNFAVDRRIPWGMVAGVEYIYNKDVNGIYYINANLPAAQSAFVGADNRPRWVGTACGSGTQGPCVTRINNAPGNQITRAIVLKNQDVGSSWNIAATLTKSLSKGFSFRGAYSYGESRNTVDPGSIASGSFEGNPQRGDPNNPGLGYSGGTAGHRIFLQANYTQNWFKFGATTVSMFWEGRTNGNASYVFSGDMNGDAASGNDLIYIPRDTSEMNFSTFTSGGVTYTADQQAAAWEAYINQDDYLKKHRGEYAERGAVFLPMVFRTDLSLVQDFFANFVGRRHTFQFRIDIDNFSNMLNSDWGVGQRLIRNQILTNATADAQGRATYRLAVVNNQLISKSFESTVGNADVYRFMISLRYLFN